MVNIFEFSNIKENRETFFYIKIINFSGDYLDSLLNCVDGNNEVLQAVLKSVAKTGIEIPELRVKENEGYEEKLNRTYSLDAQKLNDCFLQIVREWTVRGEQERKDCFEPVLNELLSHFPDEENRAEISVLVPGCGLARLPFEIAKHGFTTFGNEKDFFQLFLGSFIMNEISRKDDYRFYPWIHDLKNRMSMKDVTTPIPFPDIDPSERPDNFQFNMIPGDFLKVVQDEDLPEGSFDVIITTFFLDSTQLLEYIDALAKLLKPEGLWINFGPLNFSSEDPFAMPLNMFKSLLKNEYKFEFVKDEMVETTYGQSSEVNSMFCLNLNCAFWTCKKHLKEEE